MIDFPILIAARKKPKLGERCNGCGFCCLNEACLVSREYLHSDAAPCIALEHDGTRFICGMVRDPSKYLGLKINANAELSPLFKQMLGVEKGCDSDDQ